MKDIYLDENLSEYVAHALNALNKGYFRDVSVHSTKEKFGKGQPDEMIIPAIGKSGGFMITKDINIQRTGLQFQLCKEYGLGIFFLKMPKGMDRHWLMVKTLINNWEDIIKSVETSKAPFAFVITMKGKLKRL